MHRQFSMAKKLPVAVLAACLVLGLVSWLMLSNQTNQQAKKNIADKSHSLLLQLDELIRAPLFNNDPLSIQVALTKATRDPQVFSASLYDVDNRLVTQSRQPGTAPQEMDRFSYDIELEDTLAGTLTIEFNSQPIYLEYRGMVTYWLLLWLVFSALSTYACYRFADQLTRRIRILSNRLPGNTEKIPDELVALETKIQPLLSSSNQVNEGNNQGYYYSLVTATIKNRQQLGNQLNRENLQQLFEKIDFCTLRTLELYGGERVEGAVGNTSFVIPSSRSSKQHLLLCLMAAYSLQQLLERLSTKLGVDLEMNWVLCSGYVTTLPLFCHDEDIAKLKAQSAELVATLQEPSIVLYSEQYSIEELSSIARFLTFDNHCFILQGFPESRQLLLEKQIAHLANICLQ